MNATELQIATLLPWTDPKPVNTSRGPRMLRTAAPTGEFWNLWRQNKAELQKAGISCSKPEGGWEVCWWQNVPSGNQNASREATGATLTVQAQPKTPDPVPANITQTSVKWSVEQQAIFDWFKSGDGSLLVRARAGTGKTTTIKAAFSFAPEDRMLYAVFNKKNQREAEGKITDPRVDVKTLHAVGFACIQGVWRGVKPDDDVERERVESIQKDMPEEVGGAVMKLVGFAKNTTIAPTIGDLLDIADSRSIECENYADEEAGGWTVGKLAASALKVLEMSKIRDKQNRISFNDMVWLPVAMSWVRPMFDLVVVDEAQDMNLPQLTMAMKACKPGGRVCVVGDDRQAIYGFRGAVQNGMDMMKSKLNAKELGLTITYRCPKKVVALASAIVPDYKAADAAPEGIVEATSEHAMLDILRVEDAVLSRLNAPLMPLCLQLLRKGVSARIEGRDIGKQLSNLAKKMKGKSVPHFISKVEAWGDKQRKRAGASKHAESKIEQINDQVLTLIAVAEGAASVMEIFQRLIDLFQDSDQTTKPAVVFSSVHKAKGLEWDRVFLLSKTFNLKGKPGSKPSPGAVLEEQNIYYVAMTRAKKHLVFAQESAQPIATSPQTTTTATTNEKKG